MTETSSIRDILDFWFLPLGHPDHGKERDIWFASTPAFDAEITQRFSSLLAPACAGALDAAFWFVAVSMFMSGGLLWCWGEETHPRLNPADPPTIVVKGGQP